MQYNDIIFAILIKNKTRLIRLILLTALPSTFTILLISFLTTNIFHQKHSPYFVLTGNRLEENTFHYYNTIDVNTINSIKNKIDKNAVIFPVIYRNWANLYQLDTYTKIPISFLIVPDELIDNHLSFYIDYKKYNKTINYALVGVFASNKWDLLPNDSFFFDPNEFDFTFSKKPIKSNSKFTVAGILQDRLNLKLFQGSIIIPYSSFSNSSLNNLQPNCLFIFPKQSKLYFYKIRQILLNHHLKILVSRPPFYKSGLFFYILVFTLLWTFLIHIFTSSSIINENIKDIGILKSLGMNTLNIITIFGTAIFIINVISAIISIYFSKLILLLLNYNINKSLPFMKSIIYYNISFSSIYLIISLFFLTTISLSIYMFFTFKNVMPNLLIKRGEN